MLWDDDYVLQRHRKEEGRHASDRFANHGKDLIQGAALAAIEKLKPLPATQAETFASSFKLGTEKLTAAQDRLSATLAQIPLELPELLKDTNL